MLQGLVNYVYLANGPWSFKKVCDRFEQAEQGLQLLLFAIINTFIFEAMKTDRLRLSQQETPGPQLPTLSTGIIPPDLFKTPR